MKEFIQENGFNCIGEFVFNSKLSNDIIFLSDPDSNPKTRNVLLLFCRCFGSENLYIGFLGLSQNSKGRNGEGNIKGTFIKQFKVNLTIDDIEDIKTSNTEKIGIIINAWLLNNKKVKVFSKNLEHIDILNDKDKERTEIYKERKKMKSKIISKDNSQLLLNGGIKSENLEILIGF
jgi:hypothetical protein